MKRVQLVDIPIDPIERAAFPVLMADCVARARKRGTGPAIVQPLNVDTFNQTRSDRWLADFFLRADVVYADGQGIVWGARALGQSLPERLTAADLIWDLAEAWADGRHSVYLLGGAAGVAEIAARSLVSRYPGFRIAGVWPGHLDDEGDQRALADIAAKAPDVLAVGFGTPVQERWIARYWDQLQGVAVLWPVGAMTTYVAQTVPRAPAWMRDSGLEWAFRFALEPRRLFRRYIVGNPLFACRIAVEAGRLGLRRSGSFGAEP